VQANETSANKDYLSAYIFVIALADSLHSPVEHQIFTATKFFLDETTPEFITEDCPPQSPDCNPTDYSILDYFEKVTLGEEKSFQKTN